jgi:lipid A 3-O-deacylase
LRLAAFALAAVLVVLALPARADDVELNDDPAFLDFQAGVKDMRRDHVPAFVLEYRSSYKLWFIKPMVGVMATTRGSVYGYGGFAVDIFFGRRVVLTPSLAVGVYDNGNDRDLGTAFPEFRSAVELAYRFDDRSRLGIMFNHISNAGTGKVNPGTEQLMLSYSYPLTNLKALFGGD